MNYDDIDSEEDDESVINKWIPTNYSRNFKIGQSMK